MFFLILTLFLLISTQIQSASIHKFTRIAIDERIHGDTIIYRPKVYHDHRTYHVQKNYYPSQPYQPYQPYQPSPYSNYPSSGGIFGFQFCLACFGFSIGK